MKRKKQGVALIVGVIIFAFITTVMIAMLSMVAGNYKARVVESKRVENLYSAESGLDVAYNIIGQTFNAAVAYGNLQVTNLEAGNSTSSNSVKYSKLTQDINDWKTCLKSQTATSNDKKAYRMNIVEDNENIELLKNEEFKKGFNEFLYNDNSKDLKKTSDIDNVDELAKSIVDKQYIKDVTKSKDKGRYEKVNFNKNAGEQDPILLVYDDKTPTTGLDVNRDKSGISHYIGDRNENKSRGNKDNERKLVGDYPLMIDVFDNQQYIVKVTSNFETTSANGPNQRSVQATYTIKVPDYMQSLKKYELFDNKSLIVGKNMTVNNVKNITVNGDIFVQGEAEGGTGKIAYDKYLGGITINTSKNITFNKDVITRSTFNIQDNVGVNIKNNLYARNVYAGNAENFASGSVIDKSTLDIANDLVVDNDLTLKANYTDIKIKKFYGINDHTINDTDDTKKRNSSSIIVNKDKNDSTNPITSSVNITDEAWIMGVAYINTDGKYETGESIGVKGNYEAYSSSVATDSKDSSFSYDNPLYLINGDVFEKGKHFYDYWNIKKGWDTGGVTLPNDLTKIHSIGAIVADGKLESPKYNVDDNIKGAIIPIKQQEYASKVYKFGQTPAQNDDYYTGGEDNATLVSELMNLNNIPESYKLIDQENKSEKAIFNKEDRPIIIENTSGDSIDIPANSTSPITIHANNEMLNAIIVTNGDVIIKDNVRFKGSIITNGKLVIQGSGITITQDSAMVKNIQAQNLDVFGAVFRDGQYDNSNAANYDLSNYLDNKLWKLIK